MSDKDAELVFSTSPDGNTTNDDELEHNNNVFDNNNYCNDGTMTEQKVGTGKDEDYKMAAHSKPPAEEQSFLSANTNDEFAVDLNRILNICDDMEEVNYCCNIDRILIFYLFHAITVIFGWLNL